MYSQEMLLCIDRVDRVSVCIIVSEGTFEGVSLFQPLTQRVLHLLQVSRKTVVEMYHFVLREGDVWVGCVINESASLSQDC